MQLKGNHSINASAQTVWNLLMDPVILAKITPGISKLELVEANKYDAIAIVKMGPVNGSFKGSLEVTDKEEPNHFALKIEQNSKIGNVSAEVAIDINAISENQCEVSFNGKAKLSGLLARTGQRVLTGVANTLAKQFFKALEKEVQI